VSDIDAFAAHASLATAEVDTAAGPVTLVAPPVVTDGKRPRLGRVPALGEHDESLRREFAGATAES